MKPIQSYHHYDCLGLWDLQTSWNEYYSESST